MEIDKITNIYVPLLSPGPLVPDQSSWGLHICARFLNNNKKSSGGRPTKLSETNSCHAIRLIGSGRAENAVQVTKALRLVDNIPESFGDLPERPESRRERIWCCSAGVNYFIVIWSFSTSCYGLFAIVNSHVI